MTDGEARIGGRYRLVRQVAAGGMGAVWEGWDEQLRRPVAVKRLHLPVGLSRADAELAAERVMREARLTARLHHPNAVQVFDVVDDHGLPCLVMQYVPSRSLQDLVRAEGPLRPAAAARIGTQVAAALAAAHRAGIVHRDVKPGNVLIAEDGTAKITDFGISHAVDDVSLTSTGLVTGTPAYLAPEVARGAESDFASDVYSLGATLYMAVEGEPPAGLDTNPMATLHRVASGHTNPPVRSGMLTPLLLSMLAAVPAHRPAMVDIATRLVDVRDRGADEPPTAIIRRDTRRPAVPRPPVPVAPLPADVSPRTLAVEPPVSRPPSAPPGAVGGDPQEGRRRRWPFALLAAVVVAALIAVLLVSQLGGGNSGANTAARTGSSTSARQSAPTSRSASSRATTASSAAASTRAPKTQASSAKRSSASHTTSAAPTPGQLAQALTHYFTVVPGNLNEGWSLLTPSFQHARAGGRSNYDSYWNTIKRVAVADASGTSPGHVSATLTYYFKDGHQVTERTTFRFVEQNGVLKIDAET